MPKRAAPTASRCWTRRPAQRPASARLPRPLRFASTPRSTTPGSWSRTRWPPPASGVPREIALPPSGFVSGIYARNDIERGVHKAPANEVVRGALRFEMRRQQRRSRTCSTRRHQLPALLRGRGYPRVGRAHCLSDPEWKYVNVRRYFIYLEASIDRGTQWAVFEPNDERLWANIRADHRGTSSTTLAQRRPARRQARRRPSSSAATAPR